MSTQLMHTPSVSAEAEHTTTKWVTVLGILVIVAAIATFVWGSTALLPSILAVSVTPVLTTVTIGSVEMWGWLAVLWSLVLAVTAWQILARRPGSRQVGIVVGAVTAGFWLLAIPASPLAAIFGLALSLVIVIVIGLIVRPA